MASLQKMQEKMNEGRDEGGSIKGVEIIRSGIPELPQLPVCNPLQGPLQFGDWLLMTEPLVADLFTS